MPVTLSDFIKRSNKIHNSKYDYSKITEINGVERPVTIICPVHGKFSQMATSHLSGCGCPICNEYSKGEQSINKWLNDNNINFMFNVSVHYALTMSDPNKLELTKGNNKLKYDFYIYNSDNKIIGLIEFDGIQHFQNIQFFRNSYNEVHLRDIRKNKLAKQLEIPLLRIKYTQIRQIDSILEDFIKNISTYNDKYNPYLTNEEYYAINQAALE